MDISRVVYDLKFISLNCVINKIPCWFVRKIAYLLYGVHIGKESRIGINTIIHEPDKLYIGNRTFINDNCYLDARGGLYIGNDVSISANSCIYTTSHDVNSSIFEYQEYACKIENNVWLGANSIIISPTILRRNTVLGASCVYKGISVKNGVYVGNPGKLLGKRKIKSSYKINFNPYFR